MLVAISPFRVFVGMRTHDEVAALAKRLDVPALTDLVTATAHEDDPAHALLAARLGDATPDADRCARIARLCAHLPLALRIRLHDVMVEILDEGLIPPNPFFTAMKENA